MPYVNDGLVAAADQQLNKFLLKLSTEFKIRSSEADYFLGLEIQTTHWNKDFSIRILCKDVRKVWIY